MREENRSTPARLAGLYYVRNLVIHQGADVVWEITRAYGEGAYGKGTYGGQLHLFPPRAQLPSGRSEVGAQEYDDTVSGEEIACALRPRCRTRRWNRRWNRRAGPRPHVGHVSRRTKAALAPSGAPRRELSDGADEAAGAGGTGHTVQRRDTAPELAVRSHSHRSSCLASPSASSTATGPQMRRRHRHGRPLVHRGGLPPTPATSARARGLLWTTTDQQRIPSRHLPRAETARRRP